MGEGLASLPAIDDQHRFNRERWRELSGDSFLASLDARIETDQFGRVVMTPPPGFGHSRLQAALMERLRDLLGDAGRAQPECPLSTSAGVKGIDVVWISHERARVPLYDSLLERAPEICVEVLSPSNTRPEVEEKKRLYFEAGAEEVWLCRENGSVSFFLASNPDRDAERSSLCPEFPDRVTP